MNQLGPSRPCSWAYDASRAGLGPQPSTWPSHGLAAILPGVGMTLTLHGQLAGSSIRLEHPPHDSGRGDPTVKRCPELSDHTGLVALPAPTSGSTTSRARPREGVPRAGRAVIPHVTHNLGRKLPTRHRL